MENKGYKPKYHLTECINYLMTVTQHDVFQLFAGRLSAFGITPGQYGVLSCLWQSEGCSAPPKEISRVLRLETSTVSSVLDKMQKQGLIDRVIDPYDRRSIQVQPTETGMAIRDDVLRTIDELNAECAATFSEEEWHTLIYLLQKLGKVDEI